MTAIIQIQIVKNSPNRTNKIGKIRYYRVSILKLPLSPLIYHFRASLKSGDIVEVLFQNRIKKAIVIEEVERPKYATKEIEKKLDIFYPKSYQNIANFISIYYLCSLGDAFSLFLPFNSKKIRDEMPYKDEKYKLKPLSSKQKEAYEFIKKQKRSLLFGDTGSGKTEVYIHLIADAIKEGKNIIFLMPEISLTPQMQKRLKAIFGKTVAIWHSKITKKRKIKILEGLDNGHIKIVAGARSALFLPVKNLGLIVVDEEHDSSYKSNSRPRYNARDLAIYFGKELGVKVVLGSATPTLESYKRYPTFRLKGSYIDSKKEFIYEKSGDDLSKNILNQIDMILKAKKQAIIFLPTRANYKYISCFECGKYITCPYCSVGMSLHREKNAILCHYCNYIEPIPKRCPNCNGSKLSSFRMGTGEVKQRVQKLFPKANVANFDADAIKSVRELNKVLKEFSSGNIDILVGTQMLSKGHDYSNIALSVIMGIDSILAQNDFRARQNALSLAIQIAGRSSRSSEAKVILQTSNEEFFRKYLNEYELFLKDELKYREDLYPPFKKLARVLIAHKNEEKAKDILRETLNCLEHQLQTGVEIVGSGEANIKKIASKYRYHILLRSSSSKALLQTLLNCNNPNIEIDIDPISFS